MDCCGSGKPEEDKDVKAGKEDNPTQKETGIDLKASRVGHEKNPGGKEQTHSGSCCGGGGSGMWLHMIIMFVVFIAIWYFSKR
ncbi:Uncharacterised protein [uncultured archaeon]|nr:Uncharacterised protein [uncultured archaeon]